MSEDKEAMIRLYQTTRVEFLASIDGLTAAQMSEATIDGWSVKDHMLHIATWDEMRALEVGRISAGHASALRMTHAQDEAFNTIAYELRKELSVDQARWELETSRGRLLDAIRAASEPGLEPERYGEAGLVSRHEVEHAGWIRRWRAERGY